VLQGGHDIPDSDIRRRYWRSLMRAPEALRLVDEAVVLDNSGLHPVRMLLLKHGQVSGGLRNFRNGFSGWLPWPTDALGRSAFVAPKITSPCQASTLAARALIPAAASSQSMGGTRQWLCCGTGKHVSSEDFENCLKNPAPRNNHRPSASCTCGVSVSREDDASGESAPVRFVL
jgi:hypothetical protein